MKLHPHIFRLASILTKPAHMVPENSEEYHQRAKIQRRAYELKGQKPEFAFDEHLLTARAEWLQSQLPEFSGGSIAI